MLCFVSVDGVANATIEMSSQFDEAKHEMTATNGE